ncbi:MAG TPA: hypothetical protein VMI55_04930 [Thermoplasmata archaeon]|nr:hypothetical protein [Thermoplasmata archaeon]
MPWTIYSVPSSKRSELEAVLKDDVVSRQSQKVRDAAAMGGPSDRLYVLIEGSADGVQRAESLIAAVGEKLPATEGAALHQRFKDEEEAASSGMGLFFTEG